MAEGHAVARVPLQLSRSCIVASIQVDLSDDVLGQFRCQCRRFDKEPVLGIDVDRSRVKVQGPDETSLSVSQSKGGTVHRSTDSSHVDVNE